MLSEVLASKTLPFGSSLQKERIKTIETELDGYRNSIAKAQGTNEQLTLMQNRVEADISMVKKLTGASLNKQEILKTEYSKYSRMLHETEQALNKAKMVRSELRSLNLWSTHAND